MELFENLYKDTLPGYPCAWSHCMKYRYTLWRVWSPRPTRIFQCVGLNPSTADEIDNDPTVRRVISFAQREGCDALVMTNIYAYRATDPNHMKAAADPIGPENDEWLIKCSELAIMKVAAWGVHGEFMGRGDQVKKLIPGLLCFGRTKEGYPKHPLYLAGNTLLVAF